MKKNFLVTTGLIDTWEFEENNFLLGRWCEFYEFSDFEEKKFNKKILKKDNIIKNNIDHWDNYEKRNKDYEYLEKEIEYKGKNLTVVNCDFTNYSILKNECL